MSKQRSETTGNSTEAESLPWSPRVRGIVSLFLAFHVAAVFIAPWASPPPSSGLSRWTRDQIRPYLNLLSINNGYRFFAPDPGASNVVRYRLLLRDGSVKEGQFPDFDEHWPRQLYHRHFMIAERVNVFLEETISIFPEPVPPGELPGFHQLSRREQQQRNIQFQTDGRLHNEARGRLNRVIQPIAQRLMIEHDAEAVELWSARHLIPFRQNVIDGAQLTDDEYYAVRPLGTFQRQ